MIFGSSKKGAKPSQAKREIIERATQLLVIACDCISLRRADQKGRDPIYNNLIQ